MKSVHSFNDGTKGASNLPKLLLINPSNEHKGLGNIRSTAWPPLNLPYIAAMTPNYYQIEIIDENVASFSFKQADLVGLTAYTSSVNRAYQICRTYREHGIPTVMGGIHVSMMPQEALRYCDVVVTGEAESVWPELLRDFEQGRLKRRYDGQLADLSNLPLPRRDLLTQHHYLWGSLQTSRGCPMNCAFCSVTAFNGSRYRRRPLQAVIEELEQIPQRLVMIADDNLVGYGKRDREWASSFFETILERKIKKYFFVQASLQIGEDRELLRLAAAAGVRILFVGMESINPATLAGYNKSVNLYQIKHRQYSFLVENIRRSGIACLGAFMLGGDHEDTKVFGETLKFIQSTGIDILQLTKPTPLPGTQLWRQLQSEGRILDQNFPAAWDDYRLTKLVYKPAMMSIEEVYAGSTYLRCKFYSLGQTIKRTIGTFLTTRSPSATILAFMINRSYSKAFRESDHYKIYNRRDVFRRFD